MTWHFPALTASMPTLIALVWADVSSLLVILAPLLAVPLGAMTFYLRSIREQQLTAQADVTRRLEHAESGLRRLVGRVSEHERDFTSKEDWLRESMLARQNLARLSEAFARMDAEVDMMLVALDKGRSASDAVSGAGLTGRQRTAEQDTR